MSTTNIASHLKLMAERHPEQLAVLYPVSRDRAGLTRYQSYTYSQLDQQSDDLAAGLESMGVGRGIRTVLMVPPSLEFFSLTFALFKAGAVPVLVDPGIGLKNLGKCLDEAEPDAFIGIAKAHIARVIFGWGKRSLQKFISVSSPSGWGIHSLKSVSEMGRQRISAAAGMGENWQPAQSQFDESAAILFTSGSTGVPKGAVYSHGNFAAQVDALRQTFQIEPGEIDLCTFPLFALFAPALGMTAVIPRMDFTKPARVNPQEIVEPVQRFGINNLFGSPALLNRVARGDRTDAIPVSDDGHAATKPATVWSSMRRVLSAGAPVSASILERFASRLPPGTQIFTPYGATESLPVAVIGSDEILRETRQRTACGAGTCVGRPVSGVQVEIIEITDKPIPTWNQQLVLPQGEIGEIVVHGPMVTQEYFRRPDLTSLAKIHDPTAGRMRHRMGDVGYFDTDGRLWFCGRKSHRVITDNQTYFTEPVEGIFNTHPAVFRTALVGGRMGGKTVPVLCVEREPLPADVKDRTLSDSRFIEELLAIGSQFELTREIKTVLFHPRFPVDIRHNSKIFREKLAVWATSKIG